MNLIYGIHSVSERIKTNPGLIERIYIARGTSSRRLQETIDLARKVGLSLKFEPSAVLDHKTNNASHQGVVAVCMPQPYVEFDEILQDLSSETTLVLLDCIEDPRNLGAILRSCRGCDSPQRSRRGNLFNCLQNSRRSVGASKDSPSH